MQTFEVLAKKEKKIIKKRTKNWKKIPKIDKKCKHAMNWQNLEEMNKN